MTFLSDKQQWYLSEDEASCLEFQEQFMYICLTNFLLIQLFCRFMMNIKLVAFIILLSSIYCFKIQKNKQQKNELIPNQDRLPSFLGRGYDLLKGNPFTNRVDEGFKPSVFDFSYINSMTTDDYAFLIPDNTYSSKNMICSLLNSYSEYSGTQNYQKELGKIAQYDGLISYEFLWYAASQSREFQWIDNSTVSKKNRVTLAKAQCQMYTHNMPFDTNMINLTSNFKSGAIQAQKTNNWQQFYKNFGSHYISRVIFGGRYIAQHTYTQQSMSLFKSLAIDLKLATSVQFASILNLNMSDIQKRYITQTNIVNNKLQERKISVIGSQPPKTGRWDDWSYVVSTNLAPIYYRASSITILFDNIEGLNATKAKEDYNSYLDQYCRVHYCKYITPDRPDPKPLVVTFSQSQIIEKARSNTPFRTVDSQIKAGMRVNKIMFGGITTINSMQTSFSNGITEHLTAKIGISPFNLPTYTVPVNDQVKCVKFGLTVALGFYQFLSFQFTTFKGVVSPVYRVGTNPTQYQTLCVNSNEQHFAGFYGHYGLTFNGMGIQIMRQVMAQ